jgi:hypothetical protein
MTSLERIEQKHVDILDNGRGRMHILIKYTDGTEQKEYADEFPRVRDGLLIIPKGRYSPAII